MSPGMYTCSEFRRGTRSAAQKITRSLGLLIFLLGFATTVLGKTQSPVTLLEFTSFGCGACQQIKPLLTEMKAKGYPIQTISYDVPENKELFRRYQITTMPSFVLLCHGTEAGRFVSHGEDITQVQSRLLSLFNEATLRLQTQSQKSEPVVATQQVAAPANQIATPDTNDMQNVPQEIGTQLVQSGRNQATVRIRVYNQNAVDRGTGTIIHVNRGQGNLEALVLTCGHIFRPGKGKGRIELDVFHPETGQQVTVGGECIHYDDEIDLGFIGMPLPFAVTPVQVVPPEYRAKAGDRVVSIGCSNGENPTMLEHQVLSVDKKYFKPNDQNPDKKPFYYIQVSTAPIGGRSGGGLFVRDDAGLHLLGVCNAGDTQTNEGFFVPASIIYEEMLACQNLSFVYNDLIRKPQTGDISQVSATTAAGTPAQDPIRSTVFEERQISPPAALPTQNLSLASSSAPIQPIHTTAISSTPATLPENDHNALLLNAGLDELKRRQMEGAEIICIVKWPDQQQAGQSREMEVIRLPKK